MTIRHANRWPTYIALLSILMAASLIPVQGSAQGTQDPEVIAVEEITSASDCVLTTAAYADKAQTQLLEHEVSNCPTGSVLRADRMPLSKAMALGLPFVLTTGDPAADELAVDELKQELLLAAFGPVPPPPDASDTLFGDCGSPTYRTRYLSYNAAGGRIQVGVSYHDVEDSYPDGCDVIIIYQSFSYVTETLNDDLWWNEERYGGGINAHIWDMGCRKFVEGSTNYTYMNWRGYANYIFTDESIDRAAYPCNFWGTEYTGTVRLDA